MKIEERTTTFIAGPYSPYGTVFEAVGTIFKADFCARISRLVQSVHTAAHKSRQKIGKKIEFDFSCSAWKTRQKFSLPG